MTSRELLMWPISRAPPFMVPCLSRSALDSKSSEVADSASVHEQKERVHVNSRCAIHYGESVVPSILALADGCSQNAAPVVFLSLHVAERDA